LVLAFVKVRVIALDNLVIRITLIRMTTRFLVVTGLLALIVFGGLQSASAAPERQVVVVVDATAGPAAIAEAEAAVKAAGAEAQLRVPRTPTEQLSVTHYFAARGYRLVVGVGLDRDLAVAPVASRFPRIRFVAVEPGQVSRAVAD
jgi:basic membrane lipoprotein Med (substrate-binding protein (PBP1-ABC) superfamily)